MQKTRWHCTTPGCRNPRRQGELCATCAQAVRRARREQREIRPAIRPTGQTRWLDGRAEQQMTDGQQRWWVSVWKAAA